MLDLTTGMRQVLQDFVAPERKAHSVKLGALQKQADMQHEAVMKDL